MFYLKQIYSNKCLILSLVELLDWWNEIENNMCDHVYDADSKEMLSTLEVEKEYAKNILGEYLYLKC